MIKLDVINTLGKRVGEVELAEEVFGQEYNEALVHQVIVAQLANKRQGTKCVKNRREVRGGGRKPWRQKGTGRARQGSTRAPQWIKGGVVFAPKPRDFSKKVNKQMKDAALRSVLSQKIRDNGVMVLDTCTIPQPKTKLVATILKNIGIQKTALLVTAAEDFTLLRATRNIAPLTLAEVNLINVYDIVKNDKLVITAAAIKMLEEVYA